MNDFSALKALRYTELGSQSFVANNSTWISRILARFGYGIVYSGTAFLKGDRVNIRCTSGTTGPDITGHSSEVFAGPGQIGTVIDFRKRSPKEPDILLMVRFDAQAWDVYGNRGYKVFLPSFIDSIHPDYLNKI
jgi:hypothetical protein